MTHFPDYVQAIHEDRRRSFEAAAARAAMTRKTKKRNKADRHDDVRQFRPRRITIRQPRFGRSGFR